MFNFINEFFRTFWLASRSGNFYRDLYKKYKGYGIKYITLVISITSIIYAISFMYTLSDIQKNLEPGASDENNSIEILLKNWPDLEYDGKNISSDDPNPIYLTNKVGQKIAVIDASGKLTKAQLQKVLIAFVKDKMILWLNSEDKESNNVNISYDKIFGNSPNNIDHDFIKNFMFDKIKDVGALYFLISVPIIIALRLGMHISRNVFKIAISYSILWWLRTSPTIQSVSRLVLFSSATAELISPIILILYPPLIPLVIFLEYGLLIFAIYSVAKSQ